MIELWFVGIKVGIGFLILYAAASVTIRSAAALALDLRLSKVLVGVVILAFGTSLPEACVSFFAAWTNNTGLAVGNVLGSNIANIGLVLGVTALVRPVIYTRQAVKSEILCVLLSGVTVTLFMADRALSRLESAVLLSICIGYILYLVRCKKDLCESECEPAFSSRQDGTGKRLRHILFVAAGFAGLVFGSGVFVDGAIGVARYFHIPEWVIGLTLVAVGTSVPELATAVVATVKRESSFVVGNIMGSNALNVFFILAIVGLIRPVTMADTKFIEQLGFFLFFSIMPYPLMYFGGKIGRVKGAVLLGLYAGYIVWIARNFVTQ